MMDDLNLYEDLDEFHEQHDKKSKELQEAEEKYQQSLKTIEELRAENKTLKKTIQRLELGFQSLLDTARSEIKRKDKEIERIRKEKDDICFRRKISTRCANTNNDYHFASNFSANNPFKHNDAKCEISFMEPTATDVDVCGKERQTAEKHKLNSVNNHSDSKKHRDHSDSKKHRDALNDNDDKYQRSSYKNNVAQRTEEEHQSNKLRYRENNSNKLYEKDYGRNRSRNHGGHEKSGSKYNYDKWSRYSKRSDSYEKESHRHRSRERDEFRKKDKNFTKEGNRSKERNKTHASSKTPPDAGNKSESEKMSIKQETENLKNIYKDLGEDALANLKTEHKNASTKNSPQENEKKATRHAENLDNKTEQIKRQEKLQKTSSVTTKVELENNFGSGLPNIQHEIKAAETNAFTAATRSALFNELFGKSPSLCGSVSTSSPSSNACLRGPKGTPTQTSQIEVISSATTSAENYTDVDSGATTPINRAVEAFGNDSLCETPSDEIIWLERKNKNEINECFIPNPNSQRNFKTIGCVDLTNSVEGDTDNELDFIEIPGLDLCPRKKKVTKTDDNINTLIPIKQNLETCNEETDITTQKLPKENNFLAFNDEKTLKTTDLKEKVKMENCDNEDKSQGVLVADDTATPDKIVANEVRLFEGGTVLNIDDKNSTNSAQGLEGPSCFSRVLDKQENSLSKSPVDDINIMSNEETDFASEVVVIAVKQCNGGVVPLKNPYKIKAGELLNETNLEEPGVNIKLQVSDSNSERQKENINESHISGSKSEKSKSQIGAFRPYTTVDDTVSTCREKTNSTDHNNLALNTHIEESSCNAANVSKSLDVLSKTDYTVAQNKEVNPPLCTKILSESTVSKIDIIKTGEMSALQRDACNSTLLRSENSIELPQELDKVVESIEWQDNDKATGKITDEELCLNKKGDILSNDLSRKDSEEEKLFNKEKLAATSSREALQIEEEVVSKSEHSDRENDFKVEQKVVEKEAIATNSRKTHTHITNDAVVFSTEHTAKDGVEVKTDYLKEAKSVTEKQPHIIEKSFPAPLQKTSGLTEIECPVSTKDQWIQNKMSQPEEEPLSKDKLYDNEISVPILSQKENLSCTAEQETSSNVSEKFFKSDQSYVNSAEREQILGKDEVNTPVKVIVLPSLMENKSLEKENSVTNSETEDSAMPAKNITKINPKVLNKSSKIIVQSVEMLPPIKLVHNESESFICTTFEATPSSLTSEDNLNDGENLHKNREAVKSHRLAIQSNIESLGDESSVLQKSDKENYNTRETGIEKVKHCNGKELTATEKNPSSNIDEFCKSVLDEKSLNNEDVAENSKIIELCSQTNVIKNIEETSSTEPELIYPQQEKAENKEMLCTVGQSVEMLQNKVVGTKEEHIIPPADQEAAETLSKNSNKDTDISDNKGLEKANSTLKENPIKENSVINVSGSHVETSISETKLNEVADIIVKSTQTEALQTHEESLVENKNLKNISITIKTSNEHISQILSTEYQAAIAEERSPTEIEQRHLTDSILLNKIHCIEEKFPTEKIYGKTCETNEILNSRDSDLVNSNSKEKSPKQANEPSSKDVKKTPLMESTKADAGDEKSTETISLTKQTEPYTSLPTDKTITEVYLNTAPKGLTTGNKECPNGILSNIQHTLEEYEDDNISVTLNSKVLSKSAKHMTKDYDIGSTFVERTIRNKNIGHVANSCKEKEHISIKDINVVITNVEEKVETAPVTFQENLHTSSTSFEIIHKSADNKNGPYVVGLDKLGNDTKDKDESGEITCDESKVAAKLNNSEDAPHTIQENRSFGYKSASGEKQVDLQNRLSTDYQKSSSKADLTLKEATEHTTENISIVYFRSDKPDDPIDLLIPSTTQQANRENEITLPSLPSNSNKLSQGLVDTQNITYVKKLVSKEINIEGEIVEVVKEIADFEGTNTKTKIIQQPEKISNTEETISENAKNLCNKIVDNSGAVLSCDKSQHEKRVHEQQPALFESKKKVIPTVSPNITETLPTLPSISATLPTPSNFSGIFSKMPTSIVATEDELNKFRKKSPHLNTKPKEYILPAASVLCNVDNLENATKNNKKLHWELLDNKSEITEIEDDANIETTDNEESALQDKPLENTANPTKQKNLQKSSLSETETQTEDESLLNYARQQTGKYKKLKQPQARKIKPKLHKMGDDRPLQESSSIVLPKRPVGRPRKLDKKYGILDKHITHKKRGRKPKKITESNAVASSRLIILKSKLDTHENAPIKLKENIENFKSIESFDVERLQTEKLKTQTCFNKSPKCDKSYIDGNTKSSNECDRIVLEDLKSIENSVKSLSSSVEKLEICDEPCNSRDSFKERKSLEKQILEPRNQKDYNASLICHNQQVLKDETNTSNENGLAASKEQPEKEADSILSTTVDTGKHSEATTGSREMQNNFVDKSSTLHHKAKLFVVEEKITPAGLNVVCSKERTPLDNNTKPSSGIESSGPIQELSKPISITKPLFKKKLPIISAKNKGKNIISLEDIGINVRPPKLHLSTFRIPKINKNPEDMITSSWKLEKYVEPENMKNKNQTQESSQEEKVMQESQVVDENKLKDNCQTSTSSNLSLTDNVDKTKSKPNSVELVFKEEVHLQTEPQIKEIPKNSFKTDVANCNTKTGRRKLFSSGMIEARDADLRDKRIMGTETKYSESSSKQDLIVIETQQSGAVKQRRKSVHVSSHITKPNCGEIKSCDNSSKPPKKIVNLYRRILDSSSDEDVTLLNVSKKIKLSSNELNKSSESLQPETNQKTSNQDQTITTGLKKNKVNKQLRSRSKSLYIESCNIKGTENIHIQVNKRDTRLVGEQDAITNKLQLPDNEENECNNQQPTEAVKSLKMLRISLNAPEASPKQSKHMSCQPCTQEPIHRVKHSESEIIVKKSENKAEERDSKKLNTKEKSKDSIQQTEAGSDLTANSTHHKRLSRRRKSTNQKNDRDENNALGAIQTKIDPGYNFAGNCNEKTSSEPACEQTQIKDIIVLKKSANHCLNLKPESTINQEIQHDQNKLKQCQYDHQVSGLKRRNSYSQDVSSDASLILTQQKDESECLTKTRTVMSAAESRIILAEHPKRRRRRIAKVLSTSMDSQNNSTNASQESIKQTSPYASPLLNHPIFNNEVSSLNTEFAMTLPLTPSQQDDSELKEIDSKLYELFKSPIHATDNLTKNLLSEAASNSAPSLLSSHLNNQPQANTTQEETLDISRENDCSSLNNSQLNNSSMPLNETQTQHNNSEIKYLTMGSSQYRFEKVSDNVVNLFITRKRKRKPKN